MDSVIINDIEMFLGYVPNPQAIIDCKKHIQSYGGEPDGKVIADAVFTDELKEVFLTDYILKLFPKYNQAGGQGTGDCVSWATKFSSDVLLAIQACINGEGNPLFVAQEPIYGMAKNNLHGTTGDRGQGTSNAEAAKSIQKFGLLFRKNYVDDKIDLTNYSGSRAIDYGRNGCPDSLMDNAAEHVVKDITFIQDIDTLKKFLNNGYPAIVSSSSMPTASSKDSYGFFKNGGYYGHSEAITGWTPGNADTGGKAGFLITNLGWKVQPLGGGIYPKNLANTDLALVSFLITESATQKVLDQSDSFCLGHAVGFPAQTLPDYGTNTYL